MTYEIIAGEFAIGVGNPGNCIRGEPFIDGSQNGINCEVKVYVECDVSLVSFDYTYDNQSPSSNSVGLGVKLYDGDDVLIAEHYQAYNRNKDEWQTFTRAISGQDCFYVIVRCAHQNGYPATNKHAFIDNVHIR